LRSSGDDFAPAPPSLQRLRGRHRPSGGPGKLASGPKPRPGSRPILDEEGNRRFVRSCRTARCRIVSVTRVKEAH
jgi:hypothetical protein